MNAAHLHLLVNHMPMATILFALAGLIAGMIFKSPAIKRFGAATLVATGLFGAAAFLSGKATEEQYFGEDSPFHQFVERHEESAEVTWIAGLVGGGIALAALFATRKMSDVPGPVTVGLIVTALVLGGFFTVTANLGGHIQHSEIRSDGMSKLISGTVQEHEED